MGYLGAALSTLCFASVMAWGWWEEPPPERDETPPPPYEEEKTIYPFNRETLSPWLRDCESLFAGVACTKTQYILQMSIIDWNEGKQFSTYDNNLKLGIKLSFKGEDLDHPVLGSVTTEDEVFYSNTLSEWKINNSKRLYIINFLDSDVCFVIYKNEGKRPLGMWMLSEKR